MVKIHFKKYLPVMALILCLIPSIHAAAESIPIIDAHSQFDHNVEMEKIITLMDRAGVSKTFLSARGKIKPEQVLALSRAHKGRIVPAVRTKGRPYDENSPKYYKKLEKQLKMEGFGAMAEVIMWHARKGKKAPQVVVAPDDKRVTVALTGAIRKGWPFIAHIEFAASGNDRNIFMKKFEVMLGNYPEHPFVLIHMGQLPLEEVNRLIETYPNIHFITAHTNPVSLNRSKQPWVNMFSGNISTGYRLDTKWKELIKRHPGRFVLGFDNVFPEHWGTLYIKQVKLWRKVLDDLPADVAHKLAHENAERLWKLNPVKMSPGIH